MLFVISSKAGALMSGSDSFRLHNQKKKKKNQHSFLTFLEPQWKGKNTPADTLYRPDKMTIDELCF